MDKYVIKIALKGRAKVTADISRHFDAANWDKWLPLIVEKLEGDKEEKNHVKGLMKRYFNL